MNILELDAINKDFVVVAIIDKNKNLDSELEMLFNKKTSVSSICENYSLSQDDFSIWSNYGNDNWLVIEKSKVNNTHFKPRTSLFLKDCKVDDKLDFGDSLYQITYINRAEPNNLMKENWNLKTKEDFDMYSTTYISLVNVKKNGELGKLKCCIQNYPSPINDEVKIEFGR